MATEDPKSIVTRFNEFITMKDIDGLSALLSDDHVFIDRDGNRIEGKGQMILAWKKFFEMFPQYRNTFVEVKSMGEVIVIRGFAYWNSDNTHDSVIWTARLSGGRIKEWRIYSDAEDVRKLFHFDQ